MTSTAIEIRGLHKTSRRRGKRPERGLDGLDLHVDRGGVRGFLRPNGSGKTTTIRIMLGLAAADAGQLPVLGREVPRELPDIVGHVGALVENPLIRPGLTGRTSLRLLARSVGIPATRVEHVLEQVRLRDRADARVRAHSLGMRQRLGIAAALLKDPLLLVMDEPSNRLDPAGMNEVRELLGELGTDGRTVFLSSHLLSEVEQVCDRVSIMSRGRALVSGPVAEVLRANTGRGVTIAVLDPAAAGAVLRAAGFDVQDGPDRYLHVGTTGRRCPTRPPSTACSVSRGSGCTN